MEIRINDSWRQFIGDEFEKEYFKSLGQFLDSENDKYPGAIFPKEEQIFRAINSCDFEDVKVVILGQDPYPTRGHAHGLCFSVEEDVKPLPKSLQNIYKELQSDLNIKQPKNGSLSHWAKQGVLLLNSVLTVKEGEADSHSGKGWEQFTDAIIQSLNTHSESIVYILWGAKAQKKASFVDESKNLVLKSPHPSPLSSYRGFFDSKPFSKTNDYLVANGKAKINW
ncbi:MAG: uracil-DNA glycosylase [Fluviicola sp.]|nr:uracil-DNA glycosylase [Fluviicola sp.]